MKMHIAEREKLSCIRGKIKPPLESEMNTKSGILKIRKSKGGCWCPWFRIFIKWHLWLPIAHEIWISLSKAFCDGNYEFQVFTLNQRAFHAKQSGKTRSIYYGEFDRNFPRIRHHDKVIMKDPDDVEAYQKSIKRLSKHISCRIR